MEIQIRKRKKKTVQRTSHLSVQPHLVELKRIRKDSLVEIEKLMKSFRLLLLIDLSLYMLNQERGKHLYSTHKYRFN